jgi:17beta-estradiol 17-dehydrogenase / very-long-chain 3-oxoacyl-CoA reductase
MDSIVEINTRAQLKITKLVLNEGKMLNTTTGKGGRGLILNIGSFAALTASPMLAPYAASKAFLYTWSQALAAELEKYKIDVSLINSYFVVSNLSKIRKTNFFTPTPKQFVRKSPLLSFPIYRGAVF